MKIIGKKFAKLTPPHIAFDTDGLQINLKDSKFFNLN